MLTGDPMAYLDDWSAPDAGWLRRFYPAGVRRGPLRRDAGASRRPTPGSPACGPARSSAPSPACTPWSSCCARSSTAPRPTRETRLAELRPPTRGDRPARSPRSRPGEVAGASTLPRCATATSSSPAPPASCSPTSARSRRTSAASTGPPASASRPGTAPRASCSPRSSATAPTSPPPTRAAASRPSTTSCSPTTRQDELSDLLARVAGARRASTPTAAAPRSTTTGPRPPSAPRRRCGSSPSSCAASSTTRCGWRTGASSTWSAPIETAALDAAAAAPPQLGLEVDDARLADRPALRAPALRRPAGQPRVDSLHRARAEDELDVDGAVRPDLRRHRPPGRRTSAPSCLRAASALLQRHPRRSTRCAHGLAELVGYLALDRRRPRGRPRRRRAAR